MLLYIAVDTKRRTARKQKWGERNDYNNTSSKDSLKFLFVLFCETCESSAFQLDFYSKILKREKGRESACRYMSMYTCVSLSICEKIACVRERKIQRDKKAKEESKEIIQEWKDNKEFS